MWEQNADHSSFLHHDRLCPLLNGTIKQDEGFGESAFGAIGGGAVASSTAAAAAAAGVGASSPPGFG